jgi:hypothetical protein
VNPQDIALWGGLARDVTVTTLLILAIVGGSRGWWVYGRYYREMVDDRNFWRDQALSGTKAAEKLAALHARRGGD